MRSNLLSIDPFNVLNFLNVLTLWGIILPHLSHSLPPSSSYSYSHDYAPYGTISHIATQDSGPSAVLIAFPFPDHPLPIQNLSYTLCLTTSKAPHVACFDYPPSTSRALPIVGIAETTPLASEIAEGAVIHTEIRQNGSILDFTFSSLQASPPMPLTVPRVFLTSSPQHFIMTGDSLLVRYALYPRPEPGSLLLVRTTNGEHFTVPAYSDGELTLQSVDPGTHFMSVSSLSSGSEGPSTTLVFDAVPSQDVYNGIARKLYSTPPPDPSCGKNLGPVSVVYVGMLKYDGQKTIWLSQMSRLPGRFDKTFLTFMSLEQQAGNEPGKMIRALDEVGVPLVIRGLPAVDEATLRSTPGLDFDRLYKQGGGIKMGIVVDCLMSRLEAAGDVVSDVKPDWARETWATMVEALRSLNSDILVFANAREPTDDLLLTATRLAGVPNVVMELPNLSPKADLSQVTALVAPSRYAATHPSVVDAVAQANPAPAVTVIPPPFNTTLFTPEGPILCPAPHVPPPSPYKCPSPGPTVGFVGRISTEKSPGLFLHAASNIKSALPFARFVVVGAGKNLAQLEKMASELEVPVTFTGALYGEELAEVMRSFDVILNPSLRYESETFCIANVEAMAMGIVVVTFGVGGIGEYAVSGVNSVIVEWGENLSKEMGNATINILLDHDRRKELSSRAIETARAFDGEMVVKAYEGFYDSLM